MNVEVVTILSHRSSREFLVSGEWKWTCSASLRGVSDTLRKFVARRDGLDDENLDCLLVYEML